MTYENFLKLQRTRHMPEAAELLHIEAKAGDPNTFWQGKSGRYYRKRRLAKADDPNRAVDPNRYALVDNNATDQTATEPVQTPDNKAFDVTDIFTPQLPKETFNKLKAMSTGDIDTTKTQSKNYKNYVIFGVVVAVIAAIFIIKNKK